MKTQTVYPAYYDPLQTFLRAAFASLNSPKPAAILVSLEQLQAILAALNLPQGIDKKGQV